MKKIRRAHERNGTEFTVKLFGEPVLAVDLHSDQLSTALEAVQKMTPDAYAYISSHLPEAIDDLLLAMWYESLSKAHTPDGTPTSEDVRRVANLHKLSMQQRVGGRRPGGSLPALRINDDKRKEFSRTYDQTLSHWELSDGIYQRDPAGALRYANADGVHAWLLKDFASRHPQKSKPHRLAHYDAALRCNIEILHKAGKRKGQLVSLSTLEKQRQQGDQLLGVNRKKLFKADSKALVHAVSS